MSSSTFSRREACAAAAAFAVTPVLAGAADAAVQPRVAILGDSITAGYGLPSSQALPARLQAELARMGLSARVIPAGVSGDTTAGGLARVDRAVPKDARVAVVALGGNDLLLGEDPARVRANLDRIVARLRSRGVKVVLAGVRVPAILDGSYARAFNNAFASVARAHNVIFLPDLLEGVVLNPSLNQPDGIHPNAAGVTVIARRLAPLVAKGLQAG